MVQGSILRLKALSRRCDIRVPDVRQHSRRSIELMTNGACTELVRRTLETEREIWTIYKVILASARVYITNEAHIILTWLVQKAVWT